MSREWLSRGRFELQIWALRALVSIAACTGCTPAPDAPRPAAEAPEPKPQAQGEIRVAAASDLSLAFEELGASFTKRTGEKVSFTFGSTGLLAKQLAQGAPFDLFAAANVAFVEEAVRAGACDQATVAPYARGRIVIWSRNNTQIKPPASLVDLADARFVRIAIANPEHAPYGKAAKQALEKAGLWAQLEPRIVYGENIKQTLQYAQSGNVEAAIVALSLALGTPDGAWVEVDEALHAPIDQALVVCKHGKNQQGASAFASYVNGPDGRAIMRRYGFVLPGETWVRHP